MKLKGKVALITGAARGIGRAHALRLAGLGADIAINDINLNAHKEFEGSESGQSTLEAVEAAGVRALGVECDASQKGQAEELVQEVVSKLGKVDILINNAGGIAGDAAVSYAASFSEEDFHATLDRNLMSTVYCSQAAAEPMKAQEWGRIVNTSSQAGLQAQAGGVYATYGMAKAGIIAYTHYLATELGPFGITVNCVAPAYIATERLQANSYSKMKDPARSFRIPLGRLGDPDDVSKAVEFFVTDLGDYISGQTLSVCGGAIKF